MTRGRHVKHTAGSVIAVVAIAVGIVLLALGGVALAAYRYDRATADRILPGVTVGGVDVGGMTRAEAVEAVDTIVAERLDAPISIEVLNDFWTVSPSELGQSADVENAVDHAIAASRSTGFFARVWHRLRDQPVEIAVDLPFATTGTSVQTLVSTIAGEIASEPRDSSVTVVDGETVFVHSRPGHALGTNVAFRRLLATLDGGATAVRLPVKIVKPAVPDSKLGKTIIVDRLTNELFFYNRFDLKHTYHVATAAAGYVTPAGDWTVVDKQENPTWYNPAQDTWGAGLPASIPPGAGNPLGTRALYLDAPGIRIHGTYDVGSIGTYASHGCIRMLISDVEALYPLVPIGTRVIVF